MLRMERNYILKINVIQLLQSVGGQLMTVEKESVLSCQMETT
ncbi:protein of unknown function (plasmid) [Carnobacterium divergens]|nr:protein of unknown function [Carnobacterium divergens]